MSRTINDRKYDDESQFRVWPDDTIQPVEDGPPYSHMSDDYALVWASSEDQALRFAALMPSEDWELAQRNTMQSLAASLDRLRLPSRTRSA